MDALGRRHLLAVLVTGAAAVGESYTEKADTEFAVVVERSVDRDRPLVSLHNRTTRALAICTDFMSRWTLRHQDGRSVSSGGGLPAAGEGIGENRCQRADNWSVVPPSGDTTTWTPSLPVVKVGDELIIHWFVWVAPGVGDLASAKLGLYEWRGKIDAMKRGGRTRG